MSSSDIDQIKDRPGRLEERMGKLPSIKVLSEKFRNYVERLSPPRVQAPRKDYSRKNDIEFEQISLSLPLAIKLQSVRAKEEWKEIFSGFDTDVLAEVLLSEEELVDFMETCKLLEQLKEDEEVKEKSYLYSIISSIPGWTRCEISNDLPGTGPRSLEEAEDLEEEIDELARRRTIESLGRPEEEKPMDFSFMDPKKDPDFMPPISSSNRKRGGFLFKFASRPYDLRFQLTEINLKTGKTVTKQSKPRTFDENGRRVRDYSTIESICFLINKDNRYLCNFYSLDEDTDPSAATLENKDYKIIVKQIDRDRTKFELDLRISPIPEDGSLLPDPKNYRKIDTSSAIGMRLLVSLKECPYNEWTEQAWDWEGVRKIALVRKTKIGLAWIYLDSTEISRPWGYYNKIIYPQTKTITEKADSVLCRDKSAVDKYFQEVKGRLEEVPFFLVGYRIIGYRVRATNYEELTEKAGFRLKRALNDVVERILNDNCSFVRRSQPDVFGAIVYSFVRNDCLKSNRELYLKKLELEND